MSNIDGKKLYEVFSKTQLKEYKIQEVSREKLFDYYNGWRNEQVPRLQRQIANIQLQNLRTGSVDPVFKPLTNILKELKLNEFTLLDAGCASGYYYEVFKSLLNSKINYKGCDYSSSMVALARESYPDVDFDVQDLTNLEYSDCSFDVVVASGVLHHIPSYDKAIAQLCRVSKRYLIIHRCTISMSQEHQYSMITQYNIDRPNVLFSKEKLLKEVSDHGFTLVKETGVEQTKSILQRLKALTKQYLFNQFPTPSLKNRTFLFERQ